MIKKVYLWTNNAVTVFDEGGNQLPAFQGMHPQVADLIASSDCEQTEYFIASWQDGFNKKITKEEFRKGAV